MKATFDKAIRYFVEATCRSPLRTGGGERKTELILRDGDDRPMLQGTSIAGALRSWRQDEALFGTSDEASCLIISDLIFEEQEIVTRPRLAIDGFSGTARGNHKFDVAALSVGTKGNFQITWRGTGDADAAARSIEEYLSALHWGNISLGAMKTNGFGKVSLRVRRRIYDMKDPEDLDAWLMGDDIQDAESVFLKRVSDNETVFRVTADICGVLVKAAHRGSSDRQSYQRDKKDINRFAENIREPNGEQDVALIPGSSLKGSIRGHIHRISPHFGRTADENEKLFGRASRNNDGGIAGLVRFSDGTLSKVRSVAVPRIRISRLTCGVISRGLFSEEALDAQLTFDIRLPAKREADSAVLLYALRDLGLGLYELGSGTAVGRGRIKKLSVEIVGAAGKAELNCSDNQVTISDPDGLINKWQTALTGGNAL